MDIETPFANYAELETHGVKLRLRSEKAALRFGIHCHALAHKEVRAVLLKDAVEDAIHGIKPLHVAADLVTSGGVASQVVMGLLTRTGGVERRMLSSVAALVLPNLLSELPWSNWLGKLSSALHTKEPVSNDNGMHVMHDKHA